jgi:mycothiol synthase
VNVLVVSDLDAAQHTELLALLARCEQSDGHPALAEPQRAAVDRAQLGGGVRVVLARSDDDPDGPDGPLVGCAVLTPGNDGITSVHVAVDPDHRHNTGTATGTRSELIRAAVDAIAPTGATVRLWAMQATDDDDDEATALGFEPERDVVRMQVRLPLPEEIISASRPVSTRAFVPGQDDEAWLAINNRAFDGHPEQGGWTMEDLHERMQAPWFDLEGFRVADAPDGQGLIGSCWTKIHTHATPAVGEIYVIAVDPDRQGEGWGRALTVAGLQWLTAQGVEVGMLYTSSSNAAAVALYESLGLVVDHRDAAYLRRTPSHES